MSLTFHPSLVTIAFELLTILECVSIAPLALPVVPEGGKVYSYVAAPYEVRTEIIGILEKYAVENYITGLTLYGDGGFVMYADRLEPGSGSWDNYVPGYGFGVFSEGSAEGFLAPVK